MDNASGGESTGRGDDVNGCGVGSWREKRSGCMRREKIGKKRVSDVMDK